ncbi:unnamed protein product [Peniophora sp. CBMAI 1063]|nr:unnamed protein product [Peniophora sp. CBMAI 1063]
MSVFHDFRQWLGRQLSRQIIEESGENAFRNMRRDPMRREADGTRLSEITDKDGVPWLPGPISELRFVFSWSNDGWNPYGNKLSGVTQTSTGFWLVNMALPIEIRYLEENMFYFGAVPGKPNGSRLNPTLELLVDMFVRFWEPGVWYSRTAKHPAGRLIRAILVPQISDVLASRQVAGRGAVNLKKHFCLFCLLDRDHIECSDPSLFVPRNEQQQRHFAMLWKNAASEDERKSLAKTNDIRYTPLYRLPYHRATLDNIPESLHLFFEFLIQVYVRHCLRVHLVVDGQELSEVIKEPKHPRPSPASVNAALQILRSAPDGVLSPSAERKLEAMSEDVLFHLCKDFGLRYAGFKRQLVLNLAEWRRTVSADDAQLQSVVGPTAPALDPTGEQEPTAPPFQGSVEGGTYMVDDAPSEADTASGLSVSTMDSYPAHVDTSGNPTPEAPSIADLTLRLQSLSYEEMTSLCSRDAEKVRGALNQSRKTATVTNYCKGNKSILVAFVKILGITSAVDVTDPRLSMAAMAKALKSYSNAAASGISPEPVGPGIGAQDSSSTTQSGFDAGANVLKLEDAWLANLTTKERQLMQSPQAAAVSEHLVKGNAPATIVTAARSNAALSTDLLQAYCKSLGIASEGTALVLAERLKAYASTRYS